ncbi:MAG: AAA domain-containing protein [Bacteroidota bacterium]
MRLYDLKDNELDKLLVEAGDYLDFVLRRLYLLNEEIRSEKGCDALYLGYPVLQHRHPLNSELNFTAPLLLWKVTLKPSPQYDHWILERKQDDPIRLNQALKNWLIENHLPIPVEPPEELLEEGHLDYKALEQYVTGISEVFGIKDDWKSLLLNMDTLGPDPLPDPIDIQTTPPGFRLYTSAVLGIFQAYREAIIQDLNNYMEQGLERNLNLPNTPLFDRFEFSAVELDTAQQLTHTKVGLGGHSVIHGPPGTGKSTVLTGIITTALANHRRVLMVCEKKAALDVIANRLDELGLRQVYALIQDASADRKAVVTKARALHDKIPALPIPKKDWATHLSVEWNVLCDAWSQYGIELKKPLWNGQSVEEILIELTALSSHEAFSREGLPSVRDEHILPLLAALENEEAFETLLKYCADNLSMMVKVSNFIEQSKWPQDVLADGRQFLAYYEEQVDRNDRHIENTQRLLRIAQDLIPFQKEHEYYLIHKGLWRLVRWIGSGTYRRYRSMHQQLELYALSMDTGPGLPGPDLKHYVADLKQNLTKYNQYADLLKEISCNPSDLIGHVNCLKELRNLNLEWSPEEFSLSFSKSGKNSESEHIQRFRYSALVGVVQKQFKLLESVFSDSNLNDSMEVLEKSASECLDRILDHHMRSCQAAIAVADRKYGFKRLYNLRGQTGQTRNSLHHIASSDKVLWMTLFPVTLCTPETASILFTGDNELFDMVLFDEASQMRVEESMAAMLKGKTIVVAGDKHQMPPSNWFEATGTHDLLKDDDPESDLGALSTDSLLEYCIEHAAFSDNYLTFHYRSEHPALIEFSNAAFYGNLKPLPLRESGVPFEIHQVDGTYIYQTNPAEAVALVDALLKVDVDAEGEYPSVGVVTLNLKQRDYIVSEIISRRRASSVDDAKFLALEKAGLFVRNLENIQGDERDLIFLSTTFGRDLESQFKRNFGKLATRQGYRLLNVLITRARSQYVVFTSIPQDELSSYDFLLSSRKENWGYGLFYAWLTYIRMSVAANDWEKSPVLTLLHKNRAGESEVVNQVPESAERSAVLIALLEGALPGFGAHNLPVEFQGASAPSSMIVLIAQKVGQFEVDWLSQGDLSNSIASKAVFLLWGAAKLPHLELHYLIQRKRYLTSKGILSENFSQNV